VRNLEPFEHAEFKNGGFHASTDYVAIGRPDHRYYPSLSALLAKPADKRSDTLTPPAAPSLFNDVQRSARRAGFKESCGRAANLQEFLAKPG
jgi:hypothetical protein